MSVELFQFRYSPYNEKVRWALDLKQVTHRRIDLLPGPHMRQVRRLSGQTATPVLTIDGRTVAGSSAILHELDRLHPVPPLKMTDPEVAAIESLFDSDFGPRIRRKVLSILLGDLGYFSRLFGEGAAAGQARHVPNSAAAGSGPGAPRQRNLRSGIDRGRRARRAGRVDLRR